MNIDSKNALLRTIDKISFVIVDTALYLDTHPYDNNALNFLKENIALRNDAMEKYAKSYGPLTIDTFSSSDNHWTWLNSPMPWEGGNC